MRTNLTTTFFFALLLTLGNAALGQGTPDWVTPSRETVCDAESGAAFGLCNAYCEAMDCHLDDPQASANACTKVRNKFIQVTGRELPCEGTPCPCMNIPEFADLVNSPGDLQSCSTSGLTEVGGQLDDFLFSFAAAGSLGGAFCGFIGEALEGDSVEYLLTITEEEAVACQILLKDAAANQGVNCG